jgi:hypothetical protein
MLGIQDPRSGIQEIEENLPRIQGLKSHRIRNTALFLYGCHIKPFASLHGNVENLISTLRYR